MPGFAVIMGVMAPGYFSNFIAQGDNFTQSSLYLQPSSVSYYYMTFRIELSSFFQFRYQAMEVSILFPSLVFNNLVVCLVLLKQIQLQTAFWNYFYITFCFSSTLLH